MLVLTRKLQQQIKIGEQITVTILRVKGNTVRVGITAPRDVRVIRGELPKAAVAQDDQQLAAQAVSTTEEEALEAADDSTGPAAGERTAPSPLPPAAHLPLRRIVNRHGAAPLKRIVAACSALAK